MSDDYPRATVRMVGDQVVLDDPDALAMIKVVERHNCRLTFEEQIDRVQHFARRIVERGSSINDLVIVLLNVNDANGRQLTDILMPGQDAMWQAIRDQGQIPYARGLATRRAIEEIVTALDEVIGKKLHEIKEKAAVVVMDHGVVEAFEAP
jgi:hypothetical protein